MMINTLKGSLGRIILSYFYIGKHLEGGRIMRVSKLYHLFILFILVVVTSSCGAGGGGGGGGEGGDANVYIGDEEIDKTLTLKADAGPDQNVSSGSVVTLNGSNSTVAKSKQITFRWSFASVPAGSTATFSDYKVVNPTFTANVPGEYKIILVVSDGTLESDPDIITVIAADGNSSPVADAGKDQYISTKSVVTLNGGGSSDANGDKLTYKWILKSVPQGSKATLMDGNTVTPHFTPDIDGAYVISLVVNDGALDSNPDDITIVASSGNSMPVADAGPDRKVATGELIALDGSKSSDANPLDRLSYNWYFTSVPSGSTAVLGKATEIYPTFTPNVDGAYVISLIVNDGTIDSLVDSVTIIASKDFANNPPIANAGPDFSVSTGGIVHLNAILSTDPDNDTLNYKWSFTSIPPGSTTSISDSTTSTPSFTADVAGTYIISLVVNDGLINSAADTVTITATTLVANAGPNQLISTGSKVTLDGSKSSGYIGVKLTYNWSITSLPPGSQASLSDPTIVNPTFKADVYGDYIINLEVSDGVNSKSDSVLITATALSPVANAGIDRNVSVGSTVTLDGSKSSDPNQLPLTYKWSIVSAPIGSTASLSDPKTLNPTFTVDILGVYKFNLVVNNGYLDSQTDTVITTGMTSVCKNSYIFTECFENGIGDWSSTNGIWEIGTPTSGPGRAYIDDGVAATELDGDYIEDVNSTLVSPSIQLPTLVNGERINLRFWHWFHFPSDHYGPDTGNVNISEETSPNTWSAWNIKASFTLSSQDWSYPLVDLTSYAGKKIRLGFALINYHTYGEYSPGWYIDEIMIEKK